MGVHGSRLSTRGEQAQELPKWIIRDGEQRSSSDGILFLISFLLFRAK